MRWKVFACLAGLIVLAGSVLGVAHAWSTDATSQPAFPDVASFTTSAQSVHGGGVWQSGQAVNYLGELCHDIRSPDGWRTGVCLSPALAFEGSPILPYKGGTEAVRFLYGAVAPRIASLKLLRADCSLTDLPLSRDGMFLAVYAPAMARPYKILGFDQAGVAVASRTLHGRGVGPPESGALC